MYIRTHACMCRRIYIHIRVCIHSIVAVIGGAITTTSGPGSHVHLRVYIYMCTYSRAHIYKHTNMDPRPNNTAHAIYVCIHISICMCIQVCIHMIMLYVCLMYVCVCLYVCMYVCMGVWCARMCLNYVSVHMHS